MADVPKSLYRRYLEVSEATFQALLKHRTEYEIQHYKPILNFSSPHKGFEGCLPCVFATLEFIVHQHFRSYLCFLKCYVLIFPENRPGCLDPC
jgi:hypothetical protein